MKIITSNLNEKVPVYCKYDGQFNPQNAYIELDCRGGGEVMADYSGEIGYSVPFYYWHGLAVRWNISPETSGDSIKDLFENEEFIKACERIVDGFEEVWNGSNYVGSYTDDANNAIGEIVDMIQDLECVEVWDVDDYLFSQCSLKEFWNNQTIEEAVEEIESGIDYNMEVEGDIEDALIDKAMEYFNYNTSKLNENHVNELLKRDKITQEEYDEWMMDYCS